MKLAPGLGRGASYKCFQHYRHSHNPNGRALYSGKVALPLHTRVKFQSCCARDKFWVNSLCFCVILLMYMYTYLCSMQADTIPMQEGRLYCKEKTMQFGSRMPWWKWRVKLWYVKCSAWFLTLYFAVAANFNKRCWQNCYYIYLHSPEDDQSILIETSSCNLQFFSELITTQLRDFHMVSPQVVFPYLYIYLRWIKGIHWINIIVTINRAWNRSARFRLTATENNIPHGKVILPLLLHKWASNFQSLCSS